MKSPVTKAERDYYDDNNMRKEEEMLLDEVDEEKDAPTNLPDIKTQKKLSP